MAQVNKPINVKKLAAGAGVLVAAAFCVNLLLSPITETQLDASAMSALTTDATFKTTLGNGSRAIHVFLSTECPFCRQIEPELDQLEDVTVYRHMLPGTTESSRRLAVNVWCADDRVKEWKEIAAGRPSSFAKCDGTALEKNLLLARRLELTTTPSIVYDDGHVSTGMLSSGEISSRISKSAMR